ncbi:MAG: pantoate--beta-alanine ligase [Dissulfurimicrobium sp.]|uniref:pantoate--beta-alanine ligase n=1 Tax=Dissulfurimicrobium TaxID=1769732 RepID=UPI001EDBC0A9|nr:pantoate--beta-alanine ligase [Dissulfurimicrobium hydrothermale]UKL13147.1 pantoate--beta-alanine ligase [Dissulfurimicrobium hydrothermale]
MRLIQDLNEMTQAATEARSNGLKLCLVPTMGYFHEGHLSLMRFARKIADRVVVSLFVNPTQFGPGEDLARYPRDFERDASLADAEGVDILFCPDPADMYPEGFKTWVDVEGLSGIMCGVSRPSHFRGVATVVCKLFNIVRPDRAVFGEKDFQQLVIIRRMVKDLNMPVEIVGHPIVREKDGLAMSSRNVYLNIEERGAAVCLFEALKLAEDLVKKGGCLTERIGDEVKRHILSRCNTKIDYIFFGDPETLEPVEMVKERPVLLALAVWIGGTRLIDNIILNGPIR